MRFTISPTAPAATSTSASPPRTSSGTGTDDGLDGLSCFAAPGSPFPVLRPGDVVVVVPWSLWTGATPPLLLLLLLLLFLPPVLVVAGGPSEAPGTSVFGPTFLSFSFA